MTLAEKKSELLALVAQGENEVVEFKETTGQRVEAWAMLEKRDCEEVK